MIDRLYDLDMVALYPITIILITGAAELGNWIGLKYRSANSENADVSTLANAALGLLALLIAFSFSMAESRYDTRRNMVLEEANAIGSTANFALMLPKASREPILSLLRDYTEVRVGLGTPFNPTKLAQDVARSSDLQTQLWQYATTLTAENPQSLPAYRFVASLNEVNNIHERRLMSLRNHIPAAVMLMLVGSAMVAMGFTGYNAGVAGARRGLTTLIMSITIALLIILVVDLDRPYRGLIQVPAQALIDAKQSLPPPTP